MRLTIKVLCKSRRIFFIYHNIKNKLRFNIKNMRLTVKYLCGEVKWQTGDQIAKLHDVDCQFSAI